jgi:hypothetical protein
MKGNHEKQPIQNESGKEWCGGEIKAKQKQNGQRGDTQKNQGVAP